MLAGARVGLVWTYLAAAVAVPISHTWSAGATLASAAPFRLEVSSAGRTQQITIRGTGFENTGHPDRDQYMHWQIRRDDGGWQLCTRANAACHGAGWSGDSQTLEIGGDYVRRDGFVELRVFQGLADANESDPHRAPSPTEWSNVLRVPVVVPGGPPTIVSLSSTNFPIGGAPDAYRFFIDANLIDPSTVVVFRGDVVVHPERIDGARIQVSVPAVYRLKAPGELSLTVRTNHGGDSAPKYIRFADQKTMQVMRPGVRLDGPTMRTPSAGTVTAKPRP